MEMRSKERFSRIAVCAVGEDNRGSQKSIQELSMSTEVFTFTVNYILGSPQLFFFSVII